MTNQKGPTSTCIGCMFLEDFLSAKVTSHDIPRHDYECKKTQRIVEWNVYNTSPKTPSWCPFLKESEA